MSCGLRTPVFVVLALVGACAKQAAPTECKAACEHVTQLRLAPLKKQNQAALHELDEQDERTEDEAKVNLQRVQQEMTAGAARANAKNPHTKKLPAQAVLEHQRWEADQLRQQQELSIKRDREAALQAHQKYLDAKKDADAKVAKAAAETLQACTERCLKRSLDEAQCLTRTQAIEDIDICERK